MNNNPLISVIIPTYNYDKYIIETIESVLNQTYQPIEIIVIDDGSTDNTQEILKPYLHKIKYLFQANRGPASARNVGIRNATGEYISFLDADDMWSPTKLAIQMQIFTQNPNADLVYTESHHNYNNVTNSQSRWQQHHTTPFAESEKSLEQLFMGNLMSIHSVLFKKLFAIRVGGFDESLIWSEDYDFWLRVVASGAKINFFRTNEPLVIYRRHTGQLSRNIEKMLWGDYQALTKAISQNPDYFKDKNKLIRYRWFRLFASAAYRQLKSGKIVLGIKNAGLALIHYISGK